MLTKHQEANLDDIARTTIDRYQDEAEQRRILVKSSLHPAALTGDPVLLERLVENLIQNAVVHNSNSGGWITVRTCQAGDDVHLLVANSGIVVPTASVAHLFEPFRRATDRVDSATGSGLGLSIVRTVAEAHGGTVEATARPEGGLSVEVVLPAAQISRSRPNEPRTT
jgi:signal transduction histidine kinase